MEVFERVGEEAEIEGSAEAQWRDESKSAEDGNHPYQDRGLMRSVQGAKDACVRMGNVTITLHEQKIHFIDLGSIATRRLVWSLRKWSNSADVVQNRLSL
jgi:hypothetical protein